MTSIQRRNICSSFSLKWGRFTLNPVLIINICFNLTRCFFIISMFVKNTSLIFISSLSLPSFGIVHGNEYVIQKVKTIACAFIENPLFCTIMDRDKRKFVMSILSDARLSAGSRALLQYARDLVNFPRIATRCPWD